MIEPSVRAGNAEAIVGVLQSLGLDVPKLVADAGLSLDAWSNPEELVSLYAIDRLLVRAAAESGCDHVGLLIGVETADLGLPSYLLFNAPNLRTGLRDAIDLFSLMNEGGSLALEENAGEAALRYANIVPMLSGAPHIIDCVLAQIQSVIARYCGAKFAALEVRFPRRPPKDLKPYAPDRFDRIWSDMGSVGERCRTCPRSCKDQRAELICAGGNPAGGRMPQSCRSNVDAS